jgi:ribosome biogenesis GTPase
VLNKADLCSHRQDAIHRAQSVGGDIPVYLVSALSGEGIRELGMSFPEGTTVAFTGPSGVGKSALINSLMGEEVQATGLQRETDLRGRHTTTHKELFFLGGGAMVIDTPECVNCSSGEAKKAWRTHSARSTRRLKNCRFRTVRTRANPDVPVQQLPR